MQQQTKINKSVTKWKKLEMRKLENIFVIDVKMK